MKPLIIALFLGLLCGNAVVANKVAKTTAEGAVQTGRIINGIGVRIENFRFAVTLRLNDRFRCSGSIITLSHALTAGHCVYPIPSNVATMSIYGGSSSPISGGISIPVVNVAVHPDYDPNPPSGVFDVDVAVLTVPRNAFMGRPNMVPIALSNTDVAPGTQCYVVGFGWTNFESQTIPNVLQYTNMNIVEQETCVNIYSQYSIPITSNMTCAGGIDGVDICKGDSGSALVCGGRQYGITSFTNPICASDRPAGFMKITAPSVREFIRYQTRSWI